MLDADIVTLQETILTDDIDQAAQILGPDYRLVQQHSREDDGQGITTATRWTLGRTFEIDFHVTERTHDFACTCLVVEVLPRRLLVECGSPTISPTTSSTMNENAAYKA